ncbi:hypothetical protein [Streptomyces sp. NPDC056105]|uniref:hypothetical protein n=1 Tax=Streptomyces sp. NPDC056105 TaxID=3345714 RepID=UPI0035DAA9F6
MPPPALGFVINPSPAGRWAAHLVWLRLILVVGMLLDVAGPLLLPTLGSGAGTVALSSYFAVQDTPGTPSPWLRPGTCDDHLNETASPH